MVSVPSVSGLAAAGRTKTSVLISDGGGAPGSFFQKVTLSVSNQSSHDEPFQVAQAGAVQPRVQAAAAGVLAEEEVALQLAPGHAVEGRQLRVIALDARQPVVPEIVLGSARRPRTTP